MYDPPFGSKEERNRQKELIKALETPEEKRLRRLAKKEYKERRKKVALGWGEEYLGFTDQQNPYGDSNLLQKFVWRKKEERDEAKILGEGICVKSVEERAREARLELEKLKRRRVEREREKAERESEREFLQREKEAEYYKEWEHHEDAFHLEQVRLRSRIRIHDGRAKAIDLLARYIDETEASDDRLKADDDGTAVMHPVETCYSGLSRDDLEDLLADIDVYRTLDSAQHGQYWNDVTVLTKDYLARVDDGTGQLSCSESYGINSVVACEVDDIFKSKTYGELQTLESSIQTKIASAGENVDLSYWEALLNKLHVYMARARLRIRHRQFLRRKLAQLRSHLDVRQQCNVADGLFPSARMGSENTQTEDRGS